MARNRFGFRLSQSVHRYIHGRTTTGVQVMHIGCPGHPGPLCGRHRHKPEAATLRICPRRRPGILTAKSLVDLDTRSSCAGVLRDGSSSLDSKMRSKVTGTGMRHGAKYNDGTAARRSSGGAVGCAKAGQLFFFSSSAALSRLTERKLNGERIVIVRSR